MTPSNSKRTRWSVMSRTIASTNLKNAHILSLTHTHTDHKGILRVKGPARLGICILMLFPLALASWLIHTYLSWPDSLNYTVTGVVGYLFFYRGSWLEKGWKDDNKITLIQTNSFTNTPIHTRTGRYADSKTGLRHKWPNKRPLEANGRTVEA